MLEDIKQKLSEYLEFDVDKIINEHNDYAAIFGGAIRDSISNREIHDIDILCLSNSCRSIHDFILKNGYVENENLTMKDVYSMYKDIKCIFEPITYTKNNKIIQLIRPTGSHDFTIYWDLLKNVDLSCCGVSLSYIGLTEHINNAILHCQFNTFIINEHAKMYNKNRIYPRIDKLNKRGWIEYKLLDKDKKQKLDLIINRTKKLERICYEEN